MTPQVLGTLSTTFRIFDFRTFYMGFPSNSLRELLSGSEGAYSSVVGIQTAQYTPPSSLLKKYAFLEISYFPEPGKILENVKKRTLHATAES